MMPDASVSLWDYLFGGGRGYCCDCGGAFASEAGVLEGVGKSKVPEIIEKIKS